MRIKLCLAALAASVAVASPGHAQMVSASAQAEARGVVLQPLTLTRVQDLDFGTVVASATPGTVTINANAVGGGRTTSGGVTGVPNYPGDRALFQGAGTAGQEVTLTLTAPTLLVNQSNPMATVGASLALDSGGTTRIIGASGIFQVAVGGAFAIAANQPSGLYLANFELTAEYE